MTDAATEFFHALAARPHEPALERITGTVRFDVMNPSKRTTRWVVSITRGNIEVSRRNATADCVVRVPGPVLNDIASGNANAFAAVLRGEIEIKGDAGLLLAFQRLFPGPPRSGS